MMLIPLFGKFNNITKFLTCEETMKNLQLILLDLFNDLEPEIREIVSEVYTIEREYIDFYEKPHGINERIKNVIDKYTEYPNDTEEK